MVARKPAENGDEARAPLVRVLRNDLKELAGLSRDVRAHLARAGIEEGVIYAVDLALEELVGNTIRYGYDGEDAHEIRVEVSISKAEVRVTLEDDARPFDPTAQPEPPLPAALAAASTGGRGILMVRRMIADMRYSRRKNGNALLLVLPRPAPG